MLFDLFAALPGDIFACVSESMSVDNDKRCVMVESEPCLIESAFFPVNEMKTEKYTTTISHKNHQEFTYNEL